MKYNPKRVATHCHCGKKFSMKRSIRNRLKVIYQLLICHCWAYIFGVLICLYWCEQFHRCDNRRNQAVKNQSRNNVPHHVISQKRQAANPFNDFFFANKMQSLLRFSDLYNNFDFSGIFRCSKIDGRVIQDLIGKWITCRRKARIHFGASVIVSVSVRIPHLYAVFDKKERKLVS